MILNKRDGKIINAILKELDKTFIDDIMIMQDEIYSKLEDKDYYVQSTRDEFLFLLNGGGRVIGCLTEENELVAIGSYIKYGLDVQNYGYDLNVSGEDLYRVSQIESTIVKEGFRGNKLQKIICNELEKNAINDKMKIISATVSPKNRYSLNTFLSLGYKIEVEKEKYGGLLRYILKKNIG